MVPKQNVYVKQIGTEILKDIAKNVLKDIVPVQTIPPHNPVRD